jgi:hypothetical protein
MTSMLSHEPMERIAPPCLVTLIFLLTGALTSLAATVTETFDSYADGTALSAVGGGGVNGTAGLGAGSPIFNWKGQPFQWSALVNGAKVAMSLDFQSSATGKFDDDRVGWTIDADSPGGSADQLALQLDNTTEGGMVIYWNSTRTQLNALSGIKNSTWYRFNVEFTRLGITNASIVGTLAELDDSGNPTGTPYVGTVADTATFANPPAPARFTSAFQWPSFKNYNADEGIADNATFTFTPPYRSYTGTPITENFDGLGPTGADITLLTGWDAGHFDPAIQHGTTGGSGAATVTDALVVDDGSHLPASTPMLANFGTSGAFDRALGSIARTTPAGDQFLQLAIKNDSGSPITSFVLTYTGEQWRSPLGTNAQPLTVWYSGTSASSGFVSMGSSFTFSSPDNTPDDVPLDGNAAGNRTVISDTYTPETPIAAGSTFYIRWYDINDDGPSDGYLAIDDLTLTPNSISQPLTVGITSPANNATVGTDFTINAAVAGGDGTVTNVFFYDGSALLGNDDTSPYSYTWNSPPPGNHALAAVAWNNTGLAATSAVVNVTAWLRQVEYVIVISVDGMGSAYIPPLLTNDLLNEMTTFEQLQAEGAGTLNARDDADYAVTLPNHVTMMTGRGVEGVSGHAWTFNGYPDGEATTLELKKGSYVASGFDVAHDNGLRTGIWAGKSKFDLFHQSYSSICGALDVTGPDNGRDKIDYDMVQDGIPATTLTADFTNQMAANPLNFAFLHYQDPDTTGHSSGWSTDPTSDFATTLKAVDAQIGTILQMVTNSPILRGKTAIILTADHGGHDTTHGDITNPLDYTIPFYVWGPGVTAGGDLYVLNPITRTAPGEDSNPPYTGSQPIRNGDCANLAMALLGLGTVPGSTIGSATDKLVIAETPLLLGIARNGNGSVTMTFAGTPGAQYRVMATPDLASPDSWVDVFTNIAGPTGEWTYTDDAKASCPQRFFRAAQP